MASVNLGIWSNSNSPKRIQINNVDLEEKVQVFKTQAVKVVNNVPNNIEFSYCGLMLEDENTLASYGITDGVTIHVFEKPILKSGTPLVCDTKMAPSGLINAFRTLVLFPNYRLALQRLTRSDVINKIIEACPKLSEDPAAIALIQDPELIYYLSNPEHGAEMIEKHPVLLEAGNHIVAQVHEEQANLNPNQAGTSTGYSYSLDALSDDDEEMDSSSETNFSQNPLTRNTSFNAITAAQLAAAIANATNTQFYANSAGVPTRSDNASLPTSNSSASVPTNNSSSSNVITNEMFSSAIQQAISFGGSPNPSNTSSRMGDESFENLSRQWQAQLKQMHEMGLIDDTVNIRALRAVSGSVNAAIELVLSFNEME